MNDPAKRARRTVSQNGLITSVTLQSHSASNVTPASHSAVRGISPAARGSPRHQPGSPAARQPDSRAADDPSHTRPHANCPIGLDIGAPAGSPGTTAI